jgi:signal transduction histidine kinase
MRFFFSWSFTRLSLFVLLYLAGQKVFLVEFPWLLLLLAPILLEGGILLCYYAIRKRRMGKMSLLKTTSGLPKKPEEDWTRTQACVVHEIKNCVSTLRGNTLLLRKQLTEDSDHETLRRLERAADKIVSLTEEVLAIPKSGNPMDKRSVSVGTLVKNCISDHFPEKKSNFKINCYGPLSSIVGDEGKLEQVFINLFRNAFEAGAQDIKVCLWVDGKRIGIIIEDDGSGCSLSDPDAIFEPYTTTKAHSGGTGLGLFIVRAIVESHGGSIKVMPKNSALCDPPGMIFLLHFPVPADMGEFEMNAPRTDMLMAS